MKHAFAASLLLSFAASVATARGEGTVRTYVGKDGAWNVAANWSPEGVPDADDRACFTNTVSLTGGVSLPGTVIVDVAESQIVTFGGTLSGAGGFVKEGNGDLVVAGNNTFHGSCIVSNGTLKARGWNALGDNADGEVAVRAITPSTKLVIGGVHIRKRLVLDNRDDMKIKYHSFFVVEAGTTNRVSGELAVPRPYLRMSAEKNARIDFAGGGTFGANSGFLNRASGAEIRVVEKPMTLRNAYDSLLVPGWLVLAVPGTSMCDRIPGFPSVGNRRTLVDGALAADSTLNGSGAWNSSAACTFDLAGTRQCVTRFWSEPAFATGYVTSALPGRLESTDTGFYTNACTFTGQASFALTGGSGDVALTGASTSLGTLEIGAGKRVRLFPGASWRGGVVVKGTLVAEDASALADASFVDVWDGGKLELPAGAAAGRQARTNGVAIANAAVCTRTYVGTDGTWSNPANWSPAGVPQTGDTALFTASTTIADGFDLPGGETHVVESTKDVQVTFAGVVGGAEASLVHDGPGKLVLAATNVFTGAFVNRGGTARGAFVAGQGAPSSFGAGAGEYAEIVNHGDLTILSASMTDRPYRGVSTSAALYVKAGLDASAPFRGNCYVRDVGTLVLRAPCPELTNLSHTDSGCVDFRCPTNAFSVSPSFSAGTLRVASLADAGQPSALGAGTSFSFGQAGYPTPSGLSYAGTEDVSCNRSIRILACDGRVASYPPAYDKHEGPTFCVERAGVTATFTGAITLGDATAVHPFICCAGAGDLVFTAPVPDRFHLWKTGSGTWTLAGANAATGICTVVEGRLDVAGSLAKDQTVFVKKGATLGGGGTVGASVTFAAGSFLAAGSAAACGTLTFTTPPVFASGMTFYAKANGDAADMLDLRCGATWPAEMNVRVDATGRLAAGARRLVAWTTPPDTVFTKEGRGGTLEKRADGLYLAFADSDAFFDAAASALAPYVHSVPAGGAAALADARDQVRKLRGAGTIEADRPVTIELAAGDYVLSSPLAFTEQDSGQPHAPITWRAAEGATVRILGARPFAADRFHALTAAEAAAARIPEEQTGRVYVADVADLLPSTLSAWPTVTRMPPVPDFFVNGEFQDLARWPNRTSKAAHGWTTFTQCTSQGDEKNVGITIVTLDDRPARWSFSDGVWLYGYWGNTWYEDYVQAASWNAATKELVLAGKTTYVPTLGKQSVARKYIAVNLPEELDAPGEWWLDRAARRLYYCPVDDWENAELALSTRVGSLVSFAAGVHDVRFEGISFAYAGRVFSAGSDTARLAFDSCTCHSFAYASSFGGKDCSVRRSSFAHHGQGCIGLSGGNVKQLVRARNLVEDCSFVDFEHLTQTYCPAVSVQGCGNAVRGCLFAESSHEAIGYGGSEHLIGWSEFHDVLRETADCGAIYTGRNSTHVGSEIVGCDFHDLSDNDVTAVYFDDCDWGDDVIGCDFHNLYRALLLGGGQLHDFDWNVVSNVTQGLHVDRRGVTWAYYNSVDWLATTNWWRECYVKAGIDLESFPWTAAYPAIRPALADCPNEPWRNRFRGNYLADCSQWTTVENKFQPTNSTSYTPGTNGLVFADDVTVSTTGKKAGTGIVGFTHYDHFVGTDVISGFAAARQRVAAFRDVPSYAVSSPDESFVVRVGVDPGGRLCCRAESEGESVLDASPMGVVVDGVDRGKLHAPVAAAVRDVPAAEAPVEAEGQPCRELTVLLENVRDGATNVAVDVRAWKDGLAWRMRVDGEGERVVAGETSAWTASFSPGVSGGTIPTNDWTAVGAVTTCWHVADFAPACITNGVLYIDVAKGVTHALTRNESAALVENAVTNVVKTGYGTLLLNQALTGYTGAWHAEKGGLYVTAPHDAFGSGGAAPVVILTAKTDAVWGLMLSGTVVVDRPLDVTCCDAKTVSLLSGADVTFLRRACFHSSNLRFDLASGAVARFKGAFDVPYNLACLSGTGTILLEDVPSHHAYMWLEHTVWVRFLCAGNQIDRIYCATAGKGLVSFEVENAISAKCPSMVMHGAYAFDFAGHDAAFGTFDKQIDGGSLASATPATLCLHQSNLCSNFACSVTGALSLEKRGAAEWCQDCVVASKGGLTVAQGTFRLTKKAAWPKASHVRVVESGKLIVEGDEPFGPSTRFTVSGDGKVEVGAGVTLRCGGWRRQTTSGTTHLASGEYVASSVPGCSGTGHVEIVPAGTVLIVR